MTRRILLTGLLLAASLAGAGAAAAGESVSPIQFKNYSGRILFNVRVLIHSSRRTDAFDFFALDANQVKVCQFPVAFRPGDGVTLDIVADYFDDMGRRCEMSRTGIPYRLDRVDAGVFLTANVVATPYHPYSPYCFNVYSNMTSSTGLAASIDFRNWW